MKNIETQETIAKAYKTIEKKIDEKDFAEVFNIASKIVELEPESSKAWYYLAVGAGFGHIDFSMATGAMKNSYKFNPDRDKDIKLYQNYIINMFYSWIKTAGSNFVNNLTYLNREDLVVSCLGCCDLLENREILPYKFPSELVYKLEESYISYLFKCILEANKKNIRTVGRTKRSRTKSRVDAWRNKQEILMAAMKMLLESKHVASKNVDIYFSEYQKMIHNYTHMKSYEFYPSKKEYTIYSLKDDIVDNWNNEWRQTLSKKQQIYSQAVSRENKLKKTIKDETDAYILEHPEEKERLLAEQKELEAKNNLKVDMIKRKLKQVNALFVVCMVGAPLSLFSAFGIYYFFGYLNEDVSKASSTAEEGVTTYDLPSLIASLLILIMGAFIVGIVFTSRKKKTLNNELTLITKNKDETISIIEDYKIPSFDSPYVIKSSSASTKSQNMSISKELNDFSEDNEVEEDNDDIDDNSESEESNEGKRQLTREEALNEGWDEEEMSLDEFNDYFN